MTTVLKNIDKWRQFLGERVEKAKSLGMSEKAISDLAVQIGEFLADKVDPQNEEERMLKELWDVADADEKKAIARLMVKWASQSV